MVHPLSRSVLLLSVLALACPARADVSWLSPSRHHQFLTHGLFLDQQTTLVARDAGRAWGSFGGSLALAEVSEWATKPQLVLSGNIDTSFRVLNGPLDLRAESFDVRLAAAVDLALRPDIRISVGILHLSGHAADGILDPALFAGNGGSDHLFFRIVHDIGTSFRVGASVRPVLRSDPKASLLDMNQFAEWFPWGARDSTDTPTPYLAAGLEQYGTGALELTWHVQAGLYWGNHVRPEHSPMVRAVVGFYGGADPRLKVSRLTRNRLHFPYLGFMLHI